MVDKVIGLGLEETQMKIVAGVLIAMVAIGIIANMKDITRYVRISTM